MYTKSKKIYFISLGKVLISIYLVLSFTGCGGGSSTTPITKTAYFVDSGITGIPYYINGTYTGVTGADGSFEYTAGDTVTFKVGKITVGSFDTTNINSDGKILPQDIAGVPRGDTSNPEVLKMAQFLQSIDDDGDPTNGIVIPTATVTTFDTLAVADISTLDTVELKTVVASVGKTLKRIREVISHLDDTVVSTGIEVVPPSKPMLEGISISVDENTTSNTIVGSITILNSGTEAITSFTLNNTDIFTINNDGNISLKSGVSLDYETNTSYTLSVYATSSVGDSNVVNIDVNISNIIDTLASLSNFAGTIAENVTVGTSVGDITISSIGDSPITAITLSGIGNENFEVTTSGTITVKVGASLDYETTTDYNLTAVATNSAGNSVSVNVDISISDIIENYAPVFTSLATASVNENQTSAIDLNATDSDGDSLTYSLSGADSGSFDINTSTGVVTFKVAPNYEVKTSYTFLATANDGTVNTNQTVTITVLNVYDVLPTITDETVSLNENVAIGTVVGSVDFTTGDDSAEIFILNNYPNYPYFDINDSGVITTKTNINYENNVSYTFTVMIEQINGALNDTASVTVHIVNLVDEVPVLANFPGTIDENTTSGTVVGNITIDSRGDSDITSFTLSDTSKFDINSSGYIVSNSTFDFETTPTYNLTVYATNSAGNSATADVDINVTDIYEAVGILDTTFSTDGYDVQSEADQSQGYAVAVDSNNKIIVVGRNGGAGMYSCRIWRYNTDGTLDTTFSGDGILDYQPDPNAFQCRGVAIDTDNKIYATGYGDFIATSSEDIFTIKINTNGTMNTSFGTNGVVIHDGAAFSPNDQAHAITIDNNGKILVTGFVQDYDNLVVLRYDINGSLDTSFDSDGIVIHTAGNQNRNIGYAIKIDNDNKIIVAGTSRNTGGSADIATLWKFNNDGSVDTTFDSDGMLKVPTERTYAHGLTIDNEQNIYISGREYREIDMMIAYYDPTWWKINSNGSEIIKTKIHESNSMSEIANSIILDNFNKVLIVGTYENSQGANIAKMIIWKYNNDGTSNRDSNFGTNGEVIFSTKSYGYSIALDNQNNIFVGGTNGNNPDMIIWKYK